MTIDTENTLSRQRLDRLVQRLRRRSVPSPTAVPRLEERAGSFPLAFAQERLWLLDRLHPETTAYNVPCRLHLEGEVDPGRLHRALGLLARRHESLRTRFLTEGGSARQLVEPGTLDFAVVDLEDLSSTGREAELERLSEEEARRRFDLARGPLWRSLLLRRDRSDHLLALSLHHTVADGWSLRVLLEELLGAYRALAVGEPWPPEAPPVQMIDVAVWQRRAFDEGHWDDELAWWLDRLEGAGEQIELPTDRPRPHARRMAGRQHRRLLDQRLTSGLERLAKSASTTLFSVLTAALAISLHRHGAAAELCLGVPVANRQRRELEGLVGCLVNTLVLRLDLGGDPPALACVERSRDTLLAALAHQELPFEKLVERLRPERDLSSTPLFQVLLAYEEDPWPELGSEGLAVRAEEGANGGAKFDLELRLELRREGLASLWEYDVDLFDAVSIARLVSRWRRLLAELVAEPGRRLSELPLLESAETHQLLREWCGESSPSAGEGLRLHELVRAQAGRTPDAVALGWGPAQLSYGELLRRAERLAHRLRALGVGVESPVAVCLERSPELVIALVAALEAGAAYVPLDPDYPAERLEFMLSDCGAELVLTQPGIALPPGSRAQVLALGAELGAGAPVAAPAASDQTLAYQIYTSGSTGRPKAVGIRHRSAVELVRWAGEVFGDALETTVAATSICFDLSVFEIFAPLARGARVELVGDALSIAVARHLGRATLVNTVPSAMAELLRLGELGPAVRTVCLAGEALPRELAEAIYRGSRVERVWNLYGPSEDTTYSTASAVGRAPARVTIGRPLPGTRAHVVDPRSRPVPIGSAGELLLGGAGLARGYLGRPALSAERFVPDGFGAEAGARLYRTGDRVRQLHDGELEFLGRLDHQVKLRGFRIELGEVEAALRSLAGVGEALAAVRDGRLAVYVSTGGEFAGEEAALAELASRLPGHMLPSVWVELESFPRTPSGKLDRGRLPAPSRPRPRSDFVAPRNPLEDLVAEIFAEVLGLERVGVETSFFDLGGHSLLAVRVLSRLRAFSGRELPLQAVFESPTAAALARRLEAGSSSTGIDEPALERTAPGAAAPLSFAQERLWFLDRLEPGSSAYNVAGALHLRGGLSVPALAAALGEVVRRHQVLRARFVESGGEARQSVDPHARARLPVVDLGRLAPADGERSARALLGELARRPFDLARAPLLRSVLLSLAGARSWLSLTLHHIVCDGWSLGLLMRELGLAYGALSRGERPAWAERRYQYADYAAWQRRRLRSEWLECELAWWRERLRGLPRLLELPLDRPRRPVSIRRGGKLGVTLEKDLEDRLRWLGREHGATLFMVLLASFQAVLSRLSGQDSVAVGTPVAGRERLEFEDLVGLFVNTLILPGELGGDPSAAELVGRARGVALDAFAHRELPFERLVAELEPSRELGHTPLFQVMLVLQNAPFEAPSIEGLEVTAEDLESGEVKFDLTLTLVETPEGPRGSVRYARDLFDATTVRRLLESWRRWLEAACEAPERRSSELSLVGRSERHQVLSEWNDTGSPAGLAGPRVEELFHRRAAERPDAVALSLGSSALSYGELERRSRELGRRLRASLAGSEPAVGVCLERSLELGIALLAVFEAGASYVPLPPELPRGRLAYLIADAGIERVLGAERWAGLLPPTTPFSAVSEALVPGPATASPAAGRAPRARPEQLAYVLYTSGSTGEPKGVMVSHRALANRLLWSVADYPLTADDRVLQSASASFDFSLWELLAPWTAGARVVLAPPGAEADPAALVAEVRDQRVSGVHFVPSLLPSFLGEGELAGCRALRRVLSGGEALGPGPRDLFEERLGRPAGVELRNQYGPTECTIDVSHWVCGPGESPVPIGRPVWNCTLHVLDRRGRPAVLGARGELAAGGEVLARGYRGRAAATAERFVPDPWSPHPGGRLYRTGDLCRRRADGALEYLGRIDRQVQLRGVRLEPAEVESALLSAGGVREAVAQVREDRPGDRRLVAYAVLERGAEGPAKRWAARWRERLEKKLPAALVPSAVVVLENLPRLPSGKVDLASLPTPEWRGDEFSAPRTPLEELVAGSYAEVLGIERVGAAGDFFELGGHSLLATRLVSRLRDALGLEVPLRWIFEAPAVADLAERLSAERHSRTPAPPLEPAERAGSLPLSYAQERLWFLGRLEPGSATYNVPAALRLDGELSTHALEAALLEVVRRHEALRTRFPSFEGEPRQVVDEPQGSILSTVELTRLGPASRSAELERRLLAEARRGFDLERGPLLRASVLRLGRADHVLLVVMHHVVSDAWSMAVFLDELSALYAAASAGEPSPLAELPVQYGDYALWQRGWLRGELLASEVAWWRERLAGAPPVLDLPADRPRPALSSGRGASLAFDLGAERSSELRAEARRAGATPFMMLLAAFGALLGRLTGGADLPVGTAVAGRTRTETEALIGFFVNTLVLRLELGGEPSFTAWLGRVREVVLAAHAHQEVPFERLVEELAPERSLAYSPLFQVLFVVQNAPRGEISLGGLEAETLELTTGTSKFDLAIVLEERGPGTDEGGFRGWVEYATDLFDPTTIRRLVGQYLRLLGASLAEPATTLGGLPLLGRAERHQVAVEWAASERLAAAPGSVPEAVAARARSESEAVALRHGDHAVSYGRLSRLAHRLARRLSASGVGTDEVVALCAGRSPEMVVAMLAIWRAGGAYLPIDPALPLERRAEIVRDAGARVLLAAPELASGLGAALGADGPEVLVLGPEVETRPVSAAESAAATWVDTGDDGIHAERRAYVIYTSGSTGVPKGVSITHGGLWNLALWHLERYGVGPEDRAAHLAGLGFDASVWELWPYLVVGSTVSLASEPVRRSPAELAAWLAAERVTLSFLSTPLAEAFLAELPTAGSSLRSVLTGGDRLGRRPPPNAPFELVNHYGPTESTVVATCGEVAPEGRSVPAIGRPIAGVSAHVVDASVRAVALGVVGELLLGGSGLARGYLGRPAETASSFVPDALGGGAGGRLYRTGDLVRWLRDGSLDFVGRRDHQVKVRGWRIELGEVESVLGSCPGVAAVAVVVRPDPSGSPRLVAYTVWDERATPEEAELRALAASRLPEAMRPSIHVFLGSLPLSANGKVDRRALPEPEWGEAVVETPRTPTEELVAVAYAELLGLERVGRDGDFFALGGHSLLAPRLASRLGASLGVEVPLRAIFERPAVANLAEWIAATRGRERPPAPALAARPRSGEPPFSFPASFAQERLWFLDRLESGGAAYNVPFGVRLRGALDPALLATGLGVLERRHESLRTTLVERGGEPVQRIQPPRDVVLPVVDLSGLAASAPPARRLARAEARRLFDLAAGPLWRAGLLRLGAQDHVLSLTLHHAITDGWSMGVLVRELSAACSALARGERPELAPLAVQYADYAVWQRGWLEGEVLERQVAWWRERLAGAPALELPTDRPRGASSRGRGGRLALGFPRAVSEALVALGRRQGATSFMVFAALFANLLGRWAGQDDLSLGTPIAHRTRPEVEGLIGFFVNTLVLRTELAGAPSLVELLGRVRETTLAAFAHQDVPFEKLVAELEPERALDRSPLFQVMLALQNVPHEELELPGVEVVSARSEGVGVKLDLSLSFSDTPAGLVGEFEYAAELFDRTTIQRLGERLGTLASAAVGAPENPLEDFELSTPAERHQLRVEWNDTRIEAPSAATLEELVLDSAARRPEAVAVLSDGGHLSYGELERRGRRLGEHLRGLGAGPEVRVGLCLERSGERIVALVGILLSGAAWVPLDPAYPRGRLEFILADAGISAVVTTRSLARDLPGSGARRVLIEELPPPAAVSAGPALGSPERLAYAIYTSGSTGRPKGVMAHHRGVVNRVLWAQGRYPVGAADTVLHKASASFDISVWEVFGPLAAGARLVLAGPGEEGDPAALVRRLERERVSLVHFVPSLLAHFAAADGLERLESLRYVFAGGEVLPPELARRLTARLGVPLRNQYGPTEISIDTTEELYPPGERFDGSVPIGRPIALSALHVADRRLRPVTLGSEGELLVGGVGVTRGYLGRPALTAERFVPDPFAPVPGARLYRTGDRVRHLADGRLDFLGRLDQQVKVRGLRIEPGEVEAVLAADPAVREAVVVVCGAGTADARLVAWVTPRDGADSEDLAGSLRASLARRLPSFMVPSAIGVLADLPLLPSGKADRKALAARELPSAGELSGSAPRTPTEEVMEGVFCQLLGRERVGVDDDFFRLGGHSLLATRLVSRVRQVFGVELALRRIFERPTLAGLAAEVEALRREGEPAAPPIAASPRAGQPPYSFPPSFSQERLWFLDRLEPGSAAYNVPMALRLLGSLRPELLAASLAVLERRHETLRTTLVEREGRPVQIVHPPGDAAVPVVDLSRLEEAEPVARRLARAEALRPFELAAGPLWRSTLLRLGRAEHELLVTLHHVITDGWSSGVLVGEFSAAYTALARGERPVLAPLAVQYADWAVWQRGWLEGEVLERQVTWWRERLAGLPALELPADRPRSLGGGSRAGRLPVALPAELSTGVVELAQRLGATPFMVLAAVFAALLARRADQDDLALGVPVAHRTRSELEALIGFFVNTLVLRTELAGVASFADLVTRVRASTLDAFAHQYVPFEKLVAELEPERSLGRSPFFQVMFALQNASSPELELPGLEVSEVTTRGVGAKFELSLSLAETAAGFAGELEYDAERFDATTARRLAAQLGQASAALVEAPDRPLAELELLRPAERHQLLREWNQTRSAPAFGDEPAPTLERLVFARAAGAPEAVAVAGGGTHLSYGELARRSRALGHHLRELGAGPETRVGVCLERSPEMIAALLGTLASGAAWVPLDPAYPRERLELILEDAGIRALVTARGHLDALPETAVRRVLIEELPRSARAGSAPGFDLPDRLAYAIYTSGSTGRPKGVMVAHRGVVNRLLAGQRAYPTSAADAVLQKASPSFDISVWECFAPLAAGGRLVLARPGDESDPAALAETLARERVSLVDFVPSLLAHFVECEGLEGLAALRQVLCGGEALPPELAHRFTDRLGVPLRNQYGPTEISIDTSEEVCRPGDRFVRSVPIGRPIAGTALYVVDRRLAPVALGSSGELAVGGVGVARGYLGRPALTAERFVPDPFDASRGARLYRTGDRARQRPDGRFEFLGRLDHQVKVRGLRIELGEVEAALRAEPSVREAVAMVREGGAGSLLAAWVTPRERPPSESLAADLRASLAERLPAFLVPTAVGVLERLPLSPNGKVDRKALAELPLPASGAETRRAPRTPVEELVAGLFCEVLELERVGVEDDFFRLGGHSLLATRLVARIRRVFGVELALRQVFERPAVAALAAEIETRRRDGVAGAPPLVALGRDGEPPFSFTASFAQERLWFLDRLEPGGAVYNVPMAVRLRGALDPPLLAAGLGVLERRHETLRTTLVEREGRPVQVVHAPRDVALPLVDLSRLASPESVARRLARAEAVRPFDLAAGPLWRAGLLRLGGGEHVLFATLHHVITDGWSMAVWVRELSAACRALARGERPELAPLAVQYADWAVWQRGWLEGEVLDAQVAWWRERLEGLPALELPFDRPHRAPASGRGGRRPVRLGADVAAASAELGQRLGATPFMILAAAFAALLGRRAGCDDLALGVPVAHRTRAEIEGLIGFFVNTLVLRTELAGVPSFARLLERVRGATLDALAHQDVPFEKLVAELEPERALDRSPFFQVMLVLQNTPLPEPELPGLEVVSTEARGLGAKFALTLSLSETGEGFAGELEYDADRFDATTVGRLGAQFGRGLAALLAAPERPLAGVDWLGPTERHQLVLEWNDTAFGHARAGSLHAQVETRAASRPEAVAIASADGALSYGELVRRARRLAGRLRASGVGPEARVGICLERSPELVVGLVGVLMAGGAYVPLDPAYPRERLAFTIEDAALVAVVTCTGLVGLLPEGVPTVPIEEEPSAEAVPAAVAAAGNLAYLIYTSGSTGKPKGVAIEHRSALALVEWALGVFSERELESVLAATSINFDLSIFEIFVTLASGGTVVLVENALALSGLGAVARVTLVNTVPSAMAELVRLEALPASLEVVNLAGEPLRRTLVEAIGRACPGARILNLYGPSEDTTYSTFTRVSGTVGEPTIGRPIAATRAYTVDRRLSPVAIGRVGELLLGGSGLARGYLGRPALSAERFVPDPFGDVVGGRLYRTGDRVRPRADGELEFLGRFDHQVKIRGFRIEPGEIEAALAAHAEIREAAVLVHGKGARARLVAFVAPRVEVEEISRWLTRRLPSHLVPSAIVPLERLPRLPNGKLDRKALAARELPSTEERSEAAPRTSAEELVAGLYAELLGLEDVGSEDDFFRLGGHSLLATQLAARLRGVFGISLPLRRIFEKSTVAALAAEVEGARLREVGLETPPIARVERGGDLPTSFAQERLWFLDQLEPGGSAYNVTSAVRLVGRLDPAVLRAGLGLLTARHETLRTTFAPGPGGRPVERIAAAADPELGWLDLRALAPERRRSELRRLSAAASRRPFDLERGPLLRLQIVRLEEAEHAALLSMHHVISDAWSMGVLIRELAEAYTALADGRRPAWPELPVQYADFAAWQRRRLEGETLDRLLGYWRERLEGASVVELRADLPRPSEPTGRGRRRVFALPEALGEALRKLARERGTTLYAVLLAAFEVFLGRHTGREDVAVGAAFAGRSQLETEGLIGFFVNMLVLRGDLSGSPRFEELLSRVHETVIGALTHQEMPFDRLVEHLRPPRASDGTPWFQIAFGLQNAPASRLELPGLSVEALELEEEMARFDLTVWAWEAEGRISFSWTWRPELFLETTIERWQEQYERLLTSAVERPEARIHTLQIFGSETPEPGRSEPADSARKLLGARRRKVQWVHPNE